MLEFLRQQVKSPIFQAIIIMIVLVFLFWVPQMGDGGSRDNIAVVNGEPISFSQYNRDYEIMVNLGEFCIAGKTVLARQL